MQKLSFLLVLILTACSSVVTDKGSMVNGVWLKYEGLQNIDQAYTAPDFTADAGSTDYNLAAGTDSNCHLVVTYWEYAPGDATFSLDGNKLKYSTKSGKPVCPRVISGTLPAALNFDMKTGSGDITLNGFNGGQMVLASTGSGDIYFKQINSAQKLGFECGSGDLTAEGCSAPLITGETGSGDIYYKQLISTQQLSLECGSGDLMAEGCSAPSIIAKTGSGDISFVSCNSTDKLIADTGSGDVDIKTIVANLLSIDTGSGDATVQDSQIEVLKGSSGSGELNQTNSQINQVDFDSGSSYIKKVSNPK